ncbi:single-stranded DNA-binding protein [Candidatus Binatia bacterium]|nr:single-stranded DNA-binding protein [Candidatus Binatia bacterium]
MNLVILTGRLGGDVETRDASGRSVANFSVATDESYKDRDGNKVDKVEWHRCVAWGKTAEIIAEYLGKGDGITIFGKIQTRSWDDKESGEKRYATEIVVDRFEFPLGRANREGDDRQESRGNGRNGASRGNGGGRSNGASRGNGGGRREAFEPGDDIPDWDRR